MPIENEYKYVLRFDPELVAMLGAGRRLQQGYVSPDARIRSITDADGTARYWFTFKKWTDEGLVEIEPEITKADFERLWPVTVTRLIKTRYTFDDGGHWDVDLFGDVDRPYFVLAEVELPEGATEPPIAQRLAPFLIRAVGKDPDFTSYLLAAEDHARKMMGRLLSG